MTCLSTGNLAEKMAHRFELSTAFSRRSLPDCPGHALSGDGPKSNIANNYFKAYAKIEEAGKVDVPRHLQDGNCERKSLRHGQKLLTCAW
jgi:hypothetical protein